ncbi:MAG: ATP-binding cassette domain-containing protein [Prosthecobacter sp.]|uniref:ABC transporter ATP-binding protein n=1 Tax=Prosthecobacter sp. TaxID=1965333 RepID=UPI0019FAAFE9|nr:ATP-binding cassette domain-containing protein [Prosthecobacter sp.]MBE2284581.1 ATP-binding cassette domain-containing protein [Prosthecobacter sp.]
MSFTYPARSGQPNEQGIEILRGVSFTAKLGVVTAFTGPSGCGKTTLLSLAARILKPDSGTVDYIPLDKEQGDKFRCGYVFQSPTLIPWRTVMSNAMFGAELAGMVNEVQKTSVLELLDAVGLGDYHHRYPRELSGGMQQRLAFVRMVASNCPVLLLDEPFANSDLVVRKELQKRLLQHVKAKQCAALLVGHDLEELVKVADQVIVLSRRPAEVLETISLSELKGTGRDLELPRQELLPYVERIEAAMLKAGTD